MDLTSLFEQIGSFIATPYSVATFSVVVNVVLWRAYQKESGAKDELYEKFLASVTEIIGDYHDFAHTLDRYVERQVEARAEASRLDSGGDRAQEGS